MVRHAKKMARLMWEARPTRLVTTVSRGNERFGSLRSPDRLTPAVKPVTAGKQMPKNTSMGGAPVNRAR